MLTAISICIAQIVKEQNIDDTPCGKQNASVRAHLRYRAAGGGERVRTDGLLRARQALSQLSYTP
jgi:hypothetical protein